MSDSEQRPLSIYQVFVRNYGREGTLNEVRRDLSRIRAMGFNCLYLLPIHPVGCVGRKGTLGSPYSVRDYYAVEPSLGTMADFTDFVREAHQLDMSVIMDMVIHHTARDHEWVYEHPEYYMRDESGNFRIAVPEWSDIYDLDFDNTQLQGKLIRMLQFWARKNVDGFRFDVASLIPMSFWKKARKETDSVRKDLIWLGESVETSMVRNLRKAAVPVCSDSELSEVFDHLYPYDSLDVFYDAVLRKELKPYEQLLEYSFSVFPQGMKRVMCLENHDRQRISALLGQRMGRIENWTAFSFLCPSTAFMYNGQETMDVRTPDLFEHNPVDWRKKDKGFAELIRKLNQIRSETQPYMLAAEFPLNADALEICEYGRKKMWYGCFNVNGAREKIQINLKDGQYRNMIDDKLFTVKDGMIDADACPVYIQTEENAL